MESKPSIIIKAKVTRDLHTITEQIVLGIIMGGFLGTGLNITKRESHRIEFKNVSGILDKLFSRGEIHFSTTPAGETELECRVWCPKIAPRSFFISVFLGIVLASGVSLLFNPLIHWSLVCGVGGAIGFELIQGFRAKAILNQRIQTFVHNSHYLGAF